MPGSFILVRAAASQEQFQDVSLPEGILTTYKKFTREQPYCSVITLLKSHFGMGGLW